MKNGFRIVDTHTHLGNARHSGRSTTAEDLLRSMDRHGVDRSVVIPFPVVADYRREHDVIRRAVKEHSDRLTGAACLYPYLPLDEFREEVRRCRDEYGFAALKLQPQYHGLNPLSNASDFFFETAMENRMAVICHAGSGLPFSLPSLCMMPARKFPQLTLVVAHCGGGIFVHEAILAALFCPNIVQGGARNNSPSESVSHRRSAGSSSGQQHATRCQRGQAAPWTRHGRFRDLVLQLPQR